MKHIQKWGIIMHTLTVNTDSKKYTVYFENSFDNLPLALEHAGLQNRKLCIITDDTVSEIYLQELISVLKKSYDEVYSFVFPSGEANKTMKTIESMYRKFLYVRLDRSSVVIALGGGVCGDMAGFVAATYMRGISFVQIPTTLLSQVDSSVGGKTGIDFCGNKNLIGSFYQPDLVYINTNTLKTLPHREFSSGIAEVIKYGLIYDREYYSYIIQNKEDIKRLKVVTLQHIIKRACQIKAEIVAEDERETGKREILNFGHTFGHAIESLCNFSVLHGEAIAVGFMAALQLSRTSEEDMADIKHLLEFFRLPVSIKIENVASHVVYNQMHLDKKSKDGRITLILLKEIGHAFSDNSIQEQDILRAINFILK